VVTGFYKYVDPDGKTRQIFCEFFYLLNALKKELEINIECKILGYFQIRLMTRVIRLAMIVGILLYLLFKIQKDLFISRTI
jgi:hypothetical protein